MRTLRTSQNTHDELGADGIMSAFRARNRPLSVAELRTSLAHNADAMALLHGLPEEQIVTVADIVRHLKSSSNEGGASALTRSGRTLRVQIESMKKRKREGLG